jgi:hypothetical protein
MNGKEEEKNPEKLKGIYRLKQWNKRRIGD